MLTATDTLVSLRDSAVALKDRADSFIAELDSAIAATPKDLGAVIDALKDEVLNGLAHGATPTRGRPRVNAPTVTQDGYTCSICGKVLKNDLGLSIHVGREHPDRSKKGRREAAAKKAARKATTAAPSTEPVTEETSTLA